MISHIHRDYFEEGFATCDGIDRFQSSFKVTIRPSWSCTLYLYHFMEYRAMICLDTRLQIVMLIFPYRVVPNVEAKLGPG